MPGTAGGNAPTKNVPATGVLSVAWDGTGDPSAALAGSYVLLRTGGIATVGVQVNGPFAGDVVPEATVDGSAWMDVTGEDAVTGRSVVDLTLPGTYRFDVAGFAQFRLRCLSFTSGAASVTLLGSVARANLYGAIVGAIGSAAAGEAYTAGVTIPGNSIVRLTDGLVYPADARADSVTLLQGVVGMTTGAAQQGSQVAVVRAGPVPGLGGLTPNATYFLAAAGGITAAVPTTGTLVIVGTGQTASVFNVRVSPPAALNT